MQSFTAGVDWSSPNAKTQADQRLRGDLLRLVADYERRGNAAMPTYDDGPGVRSADAFAAVLAQTAPMLATYAPELHRYLTTVSGGPACQRARLRVLVGEAGAAHAADAPDRSRGGVRAT
jgi:hypothetical protein